MMSRPVTAGTAGDAGGATIDASDEADLSGGHRQALVGHREREREDLEVEPARWIV